MLLISRSPPTAGTAGGTALGESPPLAPPEAPPPWAAALVTCRPWAWRRAAGRGRRAAGTPRTEMWRAGWWAPLLLSLLQSVPGRSRLAPPRNVTLFSQNFTVYLTWLPGLGSPPNVTYFVTYQGYSSDQRWRRVEQCAGIEALVCPLMCLKRQDLYNKFRARVQAASARGRSPQAESGYLEYLFDMEPAPPTLVLTQMEKILRVNATYQLPPCMPWLDLKKPPQAP